ncbi:MAG TPA: M81 family metallopeptidase, partial [Myxococcota bacterium]
MIRLAYARINQETNALSPVATERADFARTHLLADDELARACTKDGVEAKGFAKNAELSGFVRECLQRGVEPVALASAWAVPGGPLTRACFDSLVDDVVTRLVRAPNIDGVYLCLHGAMGVYGLVDPEGEIVRRVREVFPDQPIVVTYDLHGNLTKGVAENVDALIAYATNPHRDHARTGAKAARMLHETCAGKKRPTMAWRSLPMLLGGGTTIDLFPPVLQIFLRMRALERRGEVLSASLLMCHPWNASPELGWSIVVVTDGDQDKAERIADDLAERAWGTRHALPPRFASAHEAIESARKATLRRKLGVVVLADASDVVTAGAPGESTALLGALIREGQGLVSYVPLRDPAAIEVLWNKSEGDVVDVELGGKLDPARNQALAVSGVIEKKTKTHGVDRTVVLAVGTVKIVIVEGPALAIRPAFFENAGLEPWQADIIVVKNFFPFRMFFLAMARLTIYVKTAGVTDFDAAFALEFAGKVHPKDVVD